MNHNTSQLRFIAGLAAVLVAFFIWEATDQAAQNEPDKKPPDKKRVEEEEDPPTKPQKPPDKKRVEEEEDTKPAPKRKIRIEDEDPIAKPARPGVASGDLTQVARQSKYAAVQHLCRKLALPYDLATPRDSAKSIRIEALPKFYGSDRARLLGMIQWTEIDAENKEIKKSDNKGSDVESIQPYEQIALDELKRFHNAKLHPYDKGQPPPYERLLAEEQVLTAVLRFHTSAKETGKRMGNDWNAVGDRLRAEMINVLREQLTELTTAKKWDTAFELAIRMVDSFPGELDQQVIAPKILELLREGLIANRSKLSRNDDHPLQLYVRLRGVIEHYPSNKQIQALQKQLKEEAQRLYDKAKAVSSSGKKEDLAVAQDLLRQAEEIWPSLDGLHKYRQEMRLKFPILRVGMRQPLPKYMSPHTASTDAELRAVDLMFESLIKFSPDAAGIGHFQPGLAEGRPLVTDLGREFQLPPNALWADGKPIELADLRATFDAHRDGRGPSNSLAWQGLFADKSVTAGGGAFRYKVNLSKGNLEPLALMKLKIVPADALKAGREDAFGKNPLGSGPFLFDDKIRSENGRDCSTFVANPHYGSRAGKLGLPHLREIRFFQYTNALEEVKKDQLSILFDLTPEEASSLKDTRFRVKLPETKQVNHRVYFLAVNHRKALLDDANVRAALSLAINREKLLDDCFRGPLGKRIHKSVNSPYPAHCWASSPDLHNRVDKNILDPFDLMLAKTKLPAAAKKLTLGLKYPAGDSAVAKAMEELAAQVQEVLGVSLELKAVDGRKLAMEVEKTFDYELAYYHYDFPDDTFWLGPLFAPKVTGNDDNIFAYKSEELRDYLQMSLAYREFAKVKEQARRFHGALVNQVPVVPLWQLDPLHALHEEVNAPPFDPLRVFTDIEKWQLERAP